MFLANDQAITLSVGEQTAAVHEIETSSEVLSKVAGNLMTEIFEFKL
jgi:hypothetical protein